MLQSFVAANSIVLNALGETHAFQRPIESSTDRYIKTRQHRRHVVCLLTLNEKEEDGSCFGFYPARCFTFLDRK